VRKTHLIILTIFASVLTGCILFGTGGHGSLKSYEYNVAKDKLEAAVNFVVKTNPNIYQDTIGIAIPTFKPGVGKDTIYDNSYNDGATYLRVFIFGVDFKNKYTFRYSGTKEHWDTSNTSSIFIVSAFDNQGNGGSEGGVNKKLLKKFTDVFEMELVDNINKQLKSKPTERY
jgi:hypothetical protein